MSRNVSATSSVWMFQMSKTSSATPGPSRCSPVLFGLFKLTPSSSTNGKSSKFLFSCSHFWWFLRDRIYEHIYGNVERKDLNFQKVIEENFGHKKLFELITMVHEQDISVANAKQVMQAIVDGDERMPSKIAEEQGFVGGANLSEEVKNAVNVCL